MNDDTRNASPSRSSIGTRQAASQRKRIESAPRLLSSDDEMEPTLTPDLSGLRGLVDGAEDEGTAFQSVAVAAVQILERALCYEEEAAEAALSLGQREKMQSMVETAQEAVQLLRHALSQKGAKVMHLCTEGPSQPAPSDGQPWWFALTDALEVLEEGTGRMASLTTAQPEGSSARALSRLIAQLLRDHHDALLLEAEQWIS